MPEEPAEFDIVERGYAERDAFSKIASENSRKLDFLGFGLIALFGGLNDSDFSFPVDLEGNLIAAGLLLALALAADLLQYVYGSLAFGALARLEERKDPADRRDLFPAAINWPTNAFFWLKLTLTAAAWIVLIVHLASNVT